MRGRAIGMVELCATPDRACGASVDVGEAGEMVSSLPELREAVEPVTMVDFGRMASLLENRRRLDMDATV